MIYLIVTAINLQTWFQGYKNVINLNVTAINLQTWFQGYKNVINLNVTSINLQTWFIMLINVKMPTFVGILTFMSMINTANES